MERKQKHSMKDTWEHGLWVVTYFVFRHGIADTRRRGLVPSPPEARAGIKMCRQAPWKTNVDAPALALVLAFTSEALVSSAHSTVDCAVAQEQCRINVFCSVLALTTFDRQWPFPFSWLLYLLWDLPIGKEIMMSKYIMWRYIMV